LDESVVVNEATPDSQVRRGVFLMFLSSMAYALNFVSIRELSESFSAYQLVLFRTVFGTAAMLPWLFRFGLDSLRTRRWGLYGFRAAVVYTGNLSWFYALAHMDLADATALSFLAPLFTAGILALWLRERLDGPRIIALSLGFAGALVLVRPGFGSVGLATFAALYMAFAYGAASAVIRALTQTEDHNAVVFYMFALNLPLAVSLMGQLFMTRSLACAEAAAVMPAFYLQLPLVALLGFVFFGQVPGLWVVPGAALIAAGGYLALRNEPRRSRRT
jgi:drug/metabolite transporter (DMT)-like permease